MVGTASATAPTTESTGCSFLFPEKLSSYPGLSAQPFQRKDGFLRATLPDVDVTAVFSAPLMFLAFPLLVIAIGMAAKATKKLPEALGRV
jgi:hypothetical protein